MFLPKILNLFLVAIFELFNISRGAPVITKSLLWFIMVPMILAPLVETLVYQYLPLRICQKWFRRYKYSFCITIVLVSIVFASRHAHMGIIGICNSLLAGIVWCFLCFVLMRKKRNPILYTTIMHACSNAIAISISIILSGITIHVE